MRCALKGLLHGVGEGKQARGSTGSAASRVPTSQAGTPTRGRRAARCGTMARPRRAVDRGRQGHGTSCSARRPSMKPTALVERASRVVTAAEVVERRRRAWRWWSAGGARARLSPPPGNSPASSSGRDLRLGRSGGFQRHERHRRARRRRAVARTGDRSARGAGSVPVHPRGFTHISSASEGKLRPTVSTQRVNCDFPPYLKESCRSPAATGTRWASTAADSRPLRSSSISSASNAPTSFHSGSSSRACLVSAASSSSSIMICKRFIGRWDRHGERAARRGDGPLLALPPGTWRTTEL